MTDAVANDIPKPAFLIHFHDGQLMDISKIKLIIWDLDDTFWRGTFTEGGVAQREDTRQAVLDLARQGIIHSIASNNEHAPIQRLLEELGLWEYFVFPAINWSSKVKQIAAIIEATQLRAPDVLFLDDKKRIREEAKDAIPDLPAPLTVEEFLELRSTSAWPTLPWKDEKLERLGQYKILEKRHLAREQYAAPDGAAKDDAAFLRDCGISCRVTRNVLPHIDRIHDLINRTNQLNFTKRRMPSLDSIHLMLFDPFRTSAVIQVSDKFGDYGICGFYSYDRRNGVIFHFLFSCRVLNMGVEQAIYRFLRRLPVSIEDGDQTVHLFDPPENFPNGDWVAISEVEELASTSEAPRSKPNMRVHFTGGCDVPPMAALCQSRFGDSMEIETKLTTLNDEGHRIWVYGASSLFRLAANPEMVRKHADVLDQIPWLDKSCYTHPIFDEPPFDVYVISAARDGFLAHYRYRDTDLVIPAEYFRIGRKIIGPEDDWDYMSKRIMLRSTRQYPPGFREFFSKNFTFEGVHDTQSYETYLEWLLGKLPRGAKLIYLNVSEIDTGLTLRNTRNWPTIEDMEAEAKHHGNLNLALDSVEKKHSNFHVVDIRKHVRSATDTYDLNHYTRKATMGQWLDLVKILGHEAPEEYAAQYAVA